MSHHPPKPRLALTLGVTGHRLTRAPAVGEDGPGAPRPFDVEAVGRRQAEGLKAVGLKG